MSKHCPYCMGPHSERGKYCCRGHARAAARQEARARGKIKRTFAKVAKGQAELKLKNKRWRDISMGRSEPEHLQALFPPGKKKKVT